MQNEQLYRRIFDAIPESLMVLDVEGPEQFRILDVNRAYERLAGMSRGHCVGKLVDEVLPPAMSTSLVQKCRRCAETGEVLERELEIELQHGRFFYHAVLRPLHDDQGVVRHIANITRDVTAARRLETVLHERAEEFRALVENSPDFISRYDVDGRIRYVSPSVLRSGRRSEQELLGRTSIEVTPGDPSARKFHDAVLEVVSAGRPVELDICIEGFVPGRGVYHQVRFSPERDAAGKVVSVLAVGRDISALKETENLLRQREREFRTLAENSPDVIMRFDPEGRYLYASPAIERATGLPSETFIGTRIGQFRTSEVSDLSASALPLQRAVQSAVRDGLPQQVELTTPDAANPRVYDFRLVPERDSAGAIASVLGISRDVTEQKAAAAALARLNVTLEARVAARTAALEHANRELESFAHTVSHDLRAPLRVINGYARVLAEEEGEQLSTRGREMVDRISQAGNTLARLIDNILEYSRAGEIPAASSTVAMTSLARELAEDMRSAYPAVRIEVGDLADAAGDPTMLRQILQNLMANACKFSSSGPVPRVEIGCQRDRSGRPIYFVRDNGVGFDMQDVDRLFGMFQRLHSEREFPGTGVGLAIVKRLIERQGGRIWAEGRPGVGATFYFALFADGATDVFEPVSRLTED